MFLGQIVLCIKKFSLHNVCMQGIFMVNQSLDSYIFWLSKNKDYAQVVNFKSTAVAPRLPNCSPSFDMICGQMDQD